MKTFWIRLVNVLLIIGLLAGYNAVLTDREKDDEIARLSAELESAKLLQQTFIQAEAAELSGGYKDGTYTGEAQGFGGTVAVEVTVTDGRIEAINVTEAANEDGAYLAMAKDIIPAMLEAQSAEVDTISGATFSSTGIKEAAAQALEKAVQ